MDDTQQALSELHAWQKRMEARPGLLSKLTRRMQHKVNTLIPERVHATVTALIRQMVKVVLVGSHYTTAAPLRDVPLNEREMRVLQKITTYRKAAAVEGGVTGAGGILLGLSDFPLLMTIKLKLLFEIAALYGYATEDYRERIYLLLIFQLAFSNPTQRHATYLKLLQWHDYSEQLPDSVQAFDWRSFQQEYRDYIDLAKLVQLLPVVGAPVGAAVNYRLLKTLGDTAMNAYRLRWFAEADQHKPAFTNGQLQKKSV
ncbi:MAG: EcsC family protein [Steroidobacteraceae bacterium]